MNSGIKELLGSDHPVLEQCAKYFFDIDGGKKIRPTMVMAVGYALNAQSTFARKRDEVVPLQKRLAEITEMIHTASLFHDDVIDKVESILGHWRFPTFYTFLLFYLSIRIRCTRLLLVEVFPQLIKPLGTS